MIIETITINNIKIVKLTGEVSFENYKEFGISLLKTIEGSPLVLLDMKEVTYLNSMGLSTIVKAYSNVKKIKGELKLSGLNKHIEKLFVITKLDKMIELYPDRQKAIDGFSRK